MNYSGLTDREVAESRSRYGDNVLTPPKKVSLWRLYADKYNDPIIRILLFAAAISLVLAFFSGGFVETIGIIIAVILATTIGFYFERDAARKFDVLTSLGEESAVKVRRNGGVTLVRRRDVVVGDIVMVETGDEVPADGRIVEAVSLQIDESSLTGEQLTSKRAAGAADDGGTHAAAVTRTGGSDDEESAGTYPADMLLRSTMVMNGRGVMRVTAVGDATEIGKVARSTTETTAVKTPLNMQLEKLARIINRWGFGISIAAFLIFLVHDMLTDDIWRTGDYLGMLNVVLRYFMMTVTLIVMAVPEGLPMAVTLSLALNMRRMLNTNNLVRKLHACETMGAVTVICTDKTGTLTENRMTVAEMRVTDASPDAEKLLGHAIALNTTADIDARGKGIGNPTETALLRWLAAQGCDYRALREEGTVVWQLPFSTERKYMATLCVLRAEGRSAGKYLFVKGAPEIIMTMCGATSPQEIHTAEGVLDDYQHKAMRTLAFGVMRWDDALTGDGDEAYMRALGAGGGLTLQAVTAVSDPVRADVPSSVATCRKAGIEVKIVTGDTAATAMEIARQIGIGCDGDGESIAGTDFAAMSDEEAYGAVVRLKVMYRARPGDKQRLVQLLQKHGEIVAVTGDGTNDAPALHHAHVGLSLGSGTSVAKEAGDMTLLDDSFRSIVHAVMWGRSLYDNIQRFLFFQLTVNVAALLLVLGGSLVGTEMPLTVTQILWVNLIMDTFAAMALASLPPSPEVMNRRPRSRDEFIITPGLFRSIMGVGIAQFAVMFAMLLHCLFDTDPGMQRHELSIFFTTFVMLQMWNLFNAKSLGTGHSAFRGFGKDRGMHIVLLMIIAGQWLIVTFGGKMFRTEPLSIGEWVAIIAATSVILWIGEGGRKLRAK